MQQDANKGRVSLFNVRVNPIRLGILALVSLLYVIIYLEKSNIGVAAPAIGKEFGIDKSQMGLIFGGFVLAYAIGQIPSGWLVDRFGPHRVISVLVPFWSVTTVLTGWGAGFASFLGLRLLTGLGASGTFPITTRAMQPWFRPAERGTIQGISHGCARLGGALVPPLTVWLTVSFGWHWVFYVCGLVGLLWAALFYLTYSRQRRTSIPGSGRKSGRNCATCACRRAARTCHGDPSYARPTCSGSHSASLVTPIAAISSSLGCPATWSNTAISR